MGSVRGWSGSSFGGAGSEPARVGCLAAAGKSNGRARCRGDRVRGGAAGRSRPEAGPRCKRAQDSDGPADAPFPDRNTEVQGERRRETPLRSRRQDGPAAGLSPGRVVAPLERWPPGWRARLLALLGGGPTEGHHWCSGPSPAGVPGRVGWGQSVVASVVTVRLSLSDSQWVGRSQRCAGSWPRLGSLFIHSPQRGRGPGSRLEQEIPLANLGRLAFVQSSPPDYYFKGNSYF